MSTLDRALRKTLADTITSARQIAEEAAQDAVRRLGVIDDEPPAYLSTEQRTLRVRLRAHARSLGDDWNSERKRLLSTKHLENEAAYEFWHRMLFGRFLVERGLLIHPDLGEPIAPSELADLASEMGESDQWALVERFAAPSLPAVFKPNDPVLAMTLDPALTRRLRDLVARLPTEVFNADDALGWTYQFWRTSEKDAVNKAGGKVGPDEIPAVTQLFTERYMVQFLLHNTLGAWWAGRVLSVDPSLAFEALDEQALRDACALPGVGWEYLRFIRKDQNGPWTPAAGTFPGWPKTAAMITYCDPCCGSGHFLVEAFLILAAMRQREEGLGGSDAARAVLKDNLHGLELDGRCVQIAAFNVALTAWKVAGGPIVLPQPHIAWIGAPPPLSQSEMAALGGNDLALRGALEHLYSQFLQAPLLGSLLEIGARDLLDVDLRTRGTAALEMLQNAEPERSEGATAAQGLLKAADLLGRRYFLLATNVPFLGRGKQAPDLATYIARRMPEAKADLATAMLQRMRYMAADGGAVASVTPQNWLFLGGYKALRKDLLSSAEMSLVAALGTRAFETISGEVVNTALVVFLATPPASNVEFVGIDANSNPDPRSKEKYLLNGALQALRQHDQLRGPDTTITLSAPHNGERLGKYADAFQGLSSGDNPVFVRMFWELPRLVGWSLLQGANRSADCFGGMQQIVHYERLAAAGTGALRGRDAFGKAGVAITVMSSLNRSFFLGTRFSDTVSVIIPKNPRHLEAVVACLLSDDFPLAVRVVDQALSVTDSSFLKIPFDLAHWQGEAARKYSTGLPEPYSDDPTQWLFHGHPAFSERGTQLHVALARIAGYRWPAEIDSNLRLSQLGRERTSLAEKLPGADADGLLPFHATSGDRTLADRLRALLAVAFETPLTPAQEADLVRASDAKLDKREARDTTLETWLRDRASRQHCALFQNRPFLWQVWDGLQDGFSAFLYYHRLDHSALEKLTFTLLGGWIADARAEGRTAHQERGLQLQQRLRTILDGETPYDIFVRWKPLAEQPIGWRPDLIDGVRLNIRPFMAAEILRDQPRLNWSKDRGTDAPSAPWFHLGPIYGGKKGDRINHHHLTLAEKRTALNEAKAS